MTLGAVDVLQTRRSKTALSLLRLVLENSVEVNGTSRWSRECFRSTSFCSVAPHRSLHWRLCISLLSRPKHKAGRPVCPRVFFSWPSHSRRHSLHLTLMASSHRDALKINSLTTDIPDPLPVNAPFPLNNTVDTDGSASGGHASVSSQYRRWTRATTSSGTRDTQSRFRKWDFHCEWPHQPDFSFMGWQLTVLSLCPDTRPIGIPGWRSCPVTPECGVTDLNPC